MTEKGSNIKHNLLSVDLSGGFGQHRSTLDRETNDQTLLEILHTSSHTTLWNQVEEKSEKENKSWSEH